MVAATNGLWKSTDAGATWILKKGDGSNQATSIFCDLVQHPTKSDVLVAAVKSDGIWRSTDGGETWEKFTAGLPTSDLNLISLDLCRSQPNVLYASIASGQATGWQLKGLFRSEDEGKTWQKIQNAPNAFCIPNAPAGVSCQGWYDNVVAVSPADPNLVWLGGASLWRSFDGGQTWTQHDYYTCSNCPLPQDCRTYVFTFHPHRNLFAVQMASVFWRT